MIWARKNDYARWNRESYVWQMAGETLFEQKQEPRKQM